MDSDIEGSSCDGERQGTDSSVVKSRTIVRYPLSVPRLSPYSRLELETDLRLPPPNWLVSGPTIQVPNTWIRGEPAEISSFGMADAETIDAVDVISASESIKKLLKIPFSNEQVSMAVHRIGKTLLLDKLDLGKHLRSASQKEKKWLKEVFIRLVQEEGENKKLPFHGHHKTTENLQTTNLLSKFLYHSLGSDYDVEEPDEEEGEIHPATALQHLPKSAQAGVSQFARQVFWQFEDIQMLIGTDLPIFGSGTYPAVSLRLQDMKSPINVLTGLDYWLDNLMCNVPELVMCYHLDGVVKRYELLKTDDIPKLENAQFSPKVIKDIAQNILSFINSNCTKEGHTYWLFKGQDEDVVKLYDLSSLTTKYPDCPWDNPFIVPVALLLYRVAHNLSQSTPSTKEKHIIVTLLDKCLTLLDKCGNRHPEIVASANCILCQMYMDNTSKSSTADGDYPSPASSSSNSDADDDEEKCEQKPSIAIPPIKITSLRKPSNKTWNSKAWEKKRSKVKLLNGSKEEKAKQTLAHVVRGLEVIKSNTQVNEECSQASPSSHLPESPTRSPLVCFSPTSPTRKPFGFAPGQAIPLPDKPKKSEAEDTENVTDTDETCNSDFSRSVGSTTKRDDTDTAKSLQDWKAENRQRGFDNKETSDGDAELRNDLALAKVDDKSQAVAKEKPFPPGSWQEDYVLSLLEKAFEAYCVLAETAWKNFKHGLALIHCHRAIKCFNACAPVCKPDSSICDVLVICGDSQLLLTHDPSNLHHHHEEYQNLSESDTIILETAVMQKSSDEFEWATEFNTETEECLECSIRCYKACLEEAKEREKAFQKSVSQKLGNACNELGVFFMNTAANLATLEDALPSTFEQTLWQESYRCFDAGIKSFEQASDTTNMALLNCNMGRLMRLCAQSFAAGSSMGTQGEFSSKERHYYIKATECYSRALSILSHKRNNPALWDSVSWELCTTHFNMACMLQDYPPVSTMTLTEIEKGVLEGMSKALALCDLEDATPSRQPLIEYRAATIHHRLASMYHNSNRNQSTHMKEKHTRSLSELHYTKAVKLFRDLDRPVELLRVELERVALLEHQFKGQTSVTARIKSLESALTILINCRDVVQQLERLSYKVVPSKQRGGAGDAMEKECKSPARGAEKLAGAGVGDTQKKSDDVMERRQGEEEKEAEAEEESKAKTSQDTKMERGVEKSSDATSLADDSTFGADKASDDTVVEMQSGSVKGGGKTEKDEKDADAGGSSKSEVEEINRLLSIFESRLQFVLLHFVKLLSGNKKRPPESLSMYKQMYAMSLGKSAQSTTAVTGDARGLLSRRLEDIFKLSESSASR